MAQLTTAPEARQLTAAVQDYAKAIYTLESRDGAASTTDLAELLEVRPASVSSSTSVIAAYDSPRAAGASPSR
jgi:Iron dependent repressor, N-terminal DNA binding domain